MKRFIVKIVLFSGIILSVILIFEILLRSIPNDYKYKNEFVLNNGDKINTLILGNSHSYRGLNPAFLEGHAFNLAYVSQTYDIDYLLFQKYAGNMPDLKNIVLNISYPTLFADLKNSSENWREKNYYLYMNLDFNYSFFNKFEVTALNSKTNLQRLVNYYFNLKVSQSCDSLGYGKYIGSAGNNFDEYGKKAAKRHSKNIHSFKSLSIFNKNRKNIYSLAKWCRDNSILFLIYTPPAYKTYVNRLNENQIQKMYDFCFELDSAFENVIYVDFLNSAKFNLNDFYNADHLNESGAEKLSKEINLVLKNH